MVARDDLVATLAAERVRLGWELERMYEAYADRFGLSLDGARKRFGRLPEAVPVDKADEWLTAMELTLEDLADPPAPPEPVTRNRGGRRPGWSRFTDDQIRACHVLYERGQSVMQIAEQVWERAGYKNARGCREALYQQFARLGLPRRERVEAVRLRTTKHGLAPKHGPRSGYAAYRRRVLRGEEDRPKCAATNKHGRPCGHRAMVGSDFCVAHDPERAADMRRVLESAWASPRLAGERHPNAKLTAAQVEAIRARPEAKLRELADEFGVSKDAIWRIRHGLSWREAA